MAGSWDFGGDTPSGAEDGSWGDPRDPIGPPLPSPLPPSSAPGREPGVGFGGVAPAPALSGQGTSAPVPWLITGLLLAAVALVLAVVTNSLWPAVLAWLLGGPAAIGLLAVYAQADTGRRANPWYAEAPLADWGRRVLVALSLLAVAVAAWTIADVVARGGN